MLDSMKKGIYAAVGCAVLSKGKIERLGKKIAEGAEASREEGRKFVDRAAKIATEKRDALEKTAREKIEEMLKKMDIPSRKEVTDLEQRVQKLEESGAKAPRT